MNLRSVRSLAAFGAAVFAASLPARPVSACGGLFCSQAAAVNQSAERIIFSNDGNGTVTAVIQIMYQGPSENFSWLLPIPAVPDEEGEIAVASDVAFQRLQAATNPQYNLSTVVEGACRPIPPAELLSDGAAAQGTTAIDTAALNPESAGVTVAASGVVGSFDWTALELNPALDDPAAAAVEWLTQNGYDVLPRTTELIGPYLESGLYLLALKLTKGSPIGAIRPIVLSYPGELPSIPIKLTAVAANDDMGVMTWMLSGARAVPFNYADLELNEARINWFSAGSNYDSVVTAAADDAGGQGFVTEFAGSTGTLSQTVWSSSEEDQWNSIRSYGNTSPLNVFYSSLDAYSGLDGFWEAVRATVRLPEGVSFEQFQACPWCETAFELDPAAYLEAIEAGVIEPMRLVQRLLDRQPYITRLYSTLSAAEMTADPVFTYNRDLRDVSNIHTARRVIECNPDLYQWQANWRIELPQGGVVRGTAQNVGVWPAAAAQQPANVRIRTLSESGPGRVMQDNSSLIGSMLQAYNDSIPEPERLPDMMSNLPSNASTGAQRESDPSPGGMRSGRPFAGSSGCAISRGAAPSASALALSTALLALGAAVVGMRRRQSR